MTLKILFLDTEECSLYAYNPPTLLDDLVVSLELVDDEGDGLGVRDIFSLREAREAIDAIADLVEACHDA